MLVFLLVSKVTWVRMVFVLLIWSTTMWAPWTPNSGLTAGGSMVTMVGLCPRDFPVQHWELQPQLPAQNLVHSRLSVNTLQFINAWKAGSLLESSRAHTFTNVPLGVSFAVFCDLTTSSCFILTLYSPVVPKQTNLNQTSLSQISLPLTVPFPLHGLQNPSDQKSTQSHLLSEAFPDPMLQTKLTPPCPPEAPGLHLHSGVYHTVLVSITALLLLQPGCEFLVDRWAPHVPHFCVILHVLETVAQLCPTLQPMDCSLTGSSVHGILQARILEWVAFPFSRGSSQPRDQMQVSCTAGRFLTIWATTETLNVLESFQL